MSAGLKTNVLPYNVQKAVSGVVSDYLIGTMITSQTKAQMTYLVKQAIQSVDPELAQKAFIDITIDKVGNVGISIGIPETSPWCDSIILSSEGNTFVANNEIYSALYMLFKGETDTLMSVIARRGLLDQGLVSICEEKDITKAVNSTMFSTALGPYAEIIVITPRPVWDSLRRDLWDKYDKNIVTELGDYLKLNMPGRDIIIKWVSLTNFNSLRGCDIHAVVVADNRAFFDRINFTAPQPWNYKFGSNLRVWNEGELAAELALLEIEPIQERE